MQERWGWRSGSLLSFKTRISFSLESSGRKGEWFGDLRMELQVTPAEGNHGRSLEPPEEVSCEWWFLFTGIRQMGGCASASEHCIMMDTWTLRCVSVIFDCKLLVHLGYHSEDFIDFKDPLDQSDSDAFVPCMILSVWLLHSLPFLVLNITSTPIKPLFRPPAWSLLWVLALAVTPQTNFDLFV